VLRGDLVTVVADRWQGRLTRARYWNEPYFDALDLLRPVARWQQARSVMTKFYWH